MDAFDANCKNVFPTFWIDGSKATMTKPFLTDLGLADLYRLARDVFRTLFVSTKTVVF